MTKAGMLLRVKGRVRGPFGRSKAKIWTMISVRMAPPMTALTIHGTVGPE